MRERRRIVDDDETIGERAAGEREKGRKDGKEFCFHAATLPWPRPACVTIPFENCQKIVKRRQPAASAQTSERFIVLGVVLLVIGYAFNRLEEKLRQWF